MYVCMYMYIMHCMDSIQYNLVYIYECLLDYSIIIFLQERSINYH